MTVTLFRF